MQVLTIDLDEDYSLIGIHTQEEDYKIAYLLNKHLSTRFYRSKNDLDFKKDNTSFSLFEYNDEQCFANYYLIANKNEKLIKNPINNGLFENVSNSLSLVKKYLIPEKKNIDYLIKIEGITDQKKIDHIVSIINSIKQVITSYQVNPSTLKSKEFLIL